MVSNTTQTIGAKEYEASFKKKKEKALYQALDIRKFEIELYWKRASYFWTFIAATLAGFIAVQASDEFSGKGQMSVVLACLGFVFSVAWFGVNKGSKFWQENWEKHVDVLEDEVMGPLYKTVLSRNKRMSCTEHIYDFFTGPSHISVSKINQLISLYVVILWSVLVSYSFLQISKDTPDKWFYYVLISVSIIMSISFFWAGKSYNGGYYHTAKLRKSRLNPNVKNDES